LASRGDTTPHVAPSRTQASQKATLPNRRAYTRPKRHVSPNTSRWSHQVLPVLANRIVLLGLLTAMIPKCSR